MQTTQNKPHHFIGIGGVGMSALARLMLQQGVKVTGSDCSASVVTENLSKEGATIYVGHAADQVPSDAMVVYSSDIPKSNCEWQQAQKTPNHLLHRAELLAKLMKTKRALTVTGTHGKTTTSALLAWVLTGGGLNPSFAIGGFLNAPLHNGAHGSGTEFVAEADESDGSFLNYHSFGSIVTNVDSDHLPYFGNFQNIKQAFSQFMRQVERCDLLFWCRDDQGLQEMAMLNEIPAGVSYGFNSQADLRAFNYRQEGWNSLFSCEWNGKIYEDICVALPGRHAALNALAVFGMALTLGVEESRLRATLASFPGVERRFTNRGQARSVLVIDDYGHHPTEVCSALAAIKGTIEGRRLIALYQPHRYTRTRDCLGTYKCQGIFDSADCVLVTDIYASGEPAIEGVSHEQIVQEVLHDFKGAVCEAVSRDQLEDRLFEILRPHDVVVCLGAGDISAFSKKLPALIEQRGITKYQLALLCGGASSEHSISLLSMQQLLPQWNQELYTLTSFGITQKGEWISEEFLKEQLIDGPAMHQRKLRIEGRKDLRIPRKLLEQIMQTDIVVPVLHGEWGEDGRIQGFCEVLGIPYVGCDVRSSATCIDKSIVKAMCVYHGIPTIPSVVLSEREWKEESATWRKKVADLGSYPLWVKPAHLGSSVCVSRVFSPEALDIALTEVFERDDIALIEKEMVGRELECAVLGNAEAHIFPPGEVLTDLLPYDYDGKYCSEATPTEAISKLTPSQIKDAMELSKRVYTLLGCKGLARVDLFLDAENRCWLNEVNTMPGFTRNSLYPRMCVANGLPISTLLDRLVILGLEAARVRSQHHVG